MMQAIQYGGLPSCIVHIYNYYIDYCPLKLSYDIVAAASILIVVWPRTVWNAEKLNIVCKLWDDTEFLPPVYSIF